MNDTSPKSDASTSPAGYDAVPYDSMPFAQTHPDRLATLATVFGMDPPPALNESFRMLELGCACGDNLIPLAMQHPQAEFHGIDFSPRQVEMAHQAIAAMGVSNVRIESMDILDFPETGEGFDYIVAHGVYSWVPANVRDRLMAICRSRLKPNGVAYVSYNVFPGWQMQRVVRDVLLYHIRHLTDPRERIEQATAFLQFMTRAVPDEIPAYAALYRRTLDSLGDPDSLPTRLYHDYLEPVNDPVYFLDFAEHAARHGLQFLAEAAIADMQTMRLPAEAGAVLERLGDDILQREQYLDFLKNRPFRQTLLCHRDVAVDRQLRADRVEQLSWAADIQSASPSANLQTKEPMEFRRGSDIQAQVDLPLVKAALLHLAETWPQHTSFADLETAARRRLYPGALVVQPGDEHRRERQELAEHLMQSYAAGLVEAHVFQPQFMTQVSERPLASPWARRQALRGGKVTNLSHHGVDLSDVNRQLLLLMDGTRDRQQLLDALVQHVESQGLVVVEEGVAMTGTREIRRALDVRLDEILQMACRLALLVA